MNQRPSRSRKQPTDQAELLKFSELHNILNCANGVEYRSSFDICILVDI